MTIFRTSWLVLLGVFAASPGSAQTPPTLPPVVVEGSRMPSERAATEQEARDEIQRTPGAVSIVGDKQIGESRAANLKDVLDFTPGVLIRPRFGSDESQISIRGSGLRNNFHLRGINILIDGFPYGNADGFSDFESLEPLTAKRIEVYRGPSALRFGGNTLGGAINLVSKTGYDAGLFEIRSEGGSFGFAKNYIGSGQVYGGGQVAADARGRLYAVWYTEGTQGRLDVLLAVAPDARRSAAPLRVHTVTGSVPDHARLAVDGAGRGIVVWEDSTAVRRRILLRSIVQGGRSLGPVRTLSQAIKAWAPAVAVVPGGFLVAWHEEQFPAIKTVVLRVTAREDGR
jgi:hypothetical protein